MSVFAPLKNTANITLLFHSASIFIDLFSQTNIILLAFPTIPENTAIAINFCLFLFLPFCLAKFTYFAVESKIIANFQCPFRNCRT